MKTQNGLKQAEEQEAKTKVATTQSTSKTTGKAPPTQATVKTQNFYGTFYLCQDQTVQGCKKSRYTATTKYITFSSTGSGNYLYMTEPKKARYRTIRVTFNWTQKGTVAYISNKSATYSEGIMNQGKTSETFSGDSFELIDDVGLIKANTGALYLKKGAF